MRQDTRSRVLAVVLPALDEASVIGTVLAAIPTEVEGMAVVPIVVDDGSTDDTGDVARSYGAVVVPHLANLGVGGATTTGLRAALLAGADVIVTMDADGQHDPADIDPMVRRLVEGAFDVVIGSRILRPIGMPPTRFLANLVLNAVTFVVYRKIVSDSQSGFKAFSRQAVERLELGPAGYEICSEIIGEIYRKNLRYTTLPIKAIYTDYSIAKGQPLLNGVNLILSMLMRLMRRV